MKLRKRLMRVAVTFWVLFLFFSIHVLLLAQAITLCQPKVKLPADFCSAVTDCLIFHQMDNLGNVYIMNADAGKLVVLNANGQLSPQYQISSEIFPIQDFAILPGNAILILGKPNNLYKYDLVNQILTDVTPENGDFNFCSNPNSPGKLVGLTTVGATNSVVVCTIEPSIDHRALHKIKIFNVDTRQYSDVAGTIGPLGGWRAWDVAIAGQDGKIYISGWVDLTQPLKAATLPSANYWVYRYDPLTAKWDVIPILTDSSVPPLDRLTNVDSSGNLYFVHYPSDTGINFIKINASGSVVWHISEEDLGGEQTLAGIMQNGKAIFIKWPSFQSAGTINECNINPS